MSVYFSRGTLPPQKTRRKCTTGGPSLFMGPYAKPRRLIPVLRQRQPGRAPQGGPLQRQQLRGAVHQGAASEGFCFDSPRAFRRSLCGGAGPSTKNHGFKSIQSISKPSGSEIEASSFSRALLLGLAQPRPRKRAQPTRNAGPKTHQAPKAPKPRSQQPKIAMLGGRGGQGTRPKTKHQHTNSKQAPKRNSSTKARQQTHRKQETLNTHPPPPIRPHVFPPQASCVLDEVHGIQAGVLEGAPGALLAEVLQGAVDLLPQHVPKVGHPCRVRQGWLHIT